MVGVLDQIDVSALQDGKVAAVIKVKIILVTE